MKKKLRNNTNRTFMILLFLVVITIVVTALSMAKYQSSYEPEGVATVASWQISVNNEDITHGSTLTNVLTLIPETSVNVTTGKIAPGYGGYFDITIDPTGTEVSFDYSIELDETSVPVDVEIVGYKVNTADTTSTGATAITDNTISVQKTLPSGGYTSSDIETCRIYWMWNDVRANDAVHTSTAIGEGTYSVAVNVTVTQVIDET